MKKAVRFTLMVAIVLSVAASAAVVYGWDGSLSPTWDIITANVYM